MKNPISYFVLFGCFCAFLAYPSPVKAASWRWVPHVVRWENPYRGNDPSRKPGFECHIRNSWGTCTVYTITKQHTPSYYNTKNYQRRVTSFGNGLNYSDCDLHDYRRQTSDRTRGTVCDYGRVRTLTY